MQDRQLIASLFRRHYERMLLTARTLLRDPEAARDVVDDVFVELMESSRTLDSRIESFLLVSVRNRCLNIVKRRMVEERANRHLSLECTAEPTLLCTRPTNRRAVLAPRRTAPPSSFPSKLAYP